MVFDGPKLLCKDQMMMSTEWEVRAKLSESAEVTDLDYWTMRRAEAFSEEAPSKRGEAVVLRG